jgi:uncharacterized membrane protein YphA (DoxX/SURF4 family)
VQTLARRRVPSTPSSGPGTLSWVGRARAVWRSDRTGAALELLRVGLGTIWALNLLFILDPVNEFFPTFRETALAFGPTTLGGSGVADFVAAHAQLFAWATAGLTAYLALAFVLGITTRLACVVGGVASVAFLLTQWLSTFQAPGGTDVGPHPLYLLAYLALFVGGAGRYLSVDRTMWARAGARFPRLWGWIATPRVQ